MLLNTHLLKKIKNLTYFKTTLSTTKAPVNLLSTENKTKTHPNQRNLFKSGICPKNPCETMKLAKLFKCLIISSIKLILTQAV